MYGRHAMVYKMRQLKQGANIKTCIKRKHIYSIGGINGQEKARTAAH